MVFSPHTLSLHVSALMSLNHIDTGERIRILSKQHFIRTLIVALHNVSVLNESSSEYVIDTLQQQGQQNESSYAQLC